MHVSVEITSGLERRLVIGVPAERIESEIASRLAKAAKSVRIKGFRPGKVPMKVVRQRFGAGVRQEVVGDVMNQSFYEAISKEALRPAGRPHIEPKTITEGRDLEFVATFEVFPDLDLVDFARLLVKRPHAEVASEDVDKMVGVLREQNASWEEVEREAIEGDRLTIDFRGTRDGEEFEGGSAEDNELVLGSGRMIEGFESGLIGCVVGDTRTLSLRFPADYHVEDLREAAVEFSVAVKIIAERVIPELDEAFFARFGVDEGGEEKFREEITNNMERELRQALRNKLKSRVLNALLAECEVDLPRSLIVQEIASLRQQTVRQYGGEAAQIDPTLLPDELFKSQAERRVALGLLIGEIITREKLVADPDRVRAMIEELASSYEEPDDVINYYYSNQEQLSGLESSVLEDQAVERVLADAEVEIEELSYEQALAPDSEAGDDTAETAESPAEKGTDIDNRGDLQRGEQAPD